MRGFKELKSGVFNAEFTNEKLRTIEFKEATAYFVPKPFRAKID
jgi:hypothetical protein